MTEILNIYIKKKNSFALFNSILEYNYKDLHLNISSLEKYLRL